MIGPTPHRPHPTEHPVEHPIASRHPAPIPPWGRRPGRHRHGTGTLVGGGLLLALVTTACTATGTTGPPPTPAPTSEPATVTEVPQPAAGRTGPLLTVTGTVDWTTLGHPGCATLRTAHGQVLELVDAAGSRGPVIHQRQQGAAAGHGPTRQTERVVGYVPAGVVSSCGGAMSFSVEQVTP